METKDKYRQYIKNKYPEQYQILLNIERANEEAMQLPKDPLVERLEILGFRRIAVTALSNSHFFCMPGDKKGEHGLTFQKGEGNYSRTGELSISYEQGVDVFKSFGQILKEGSYSLEEFDMLLDRMERSQFYRGKKANKARIPVLSMLQRKVYDSLPQIFPWAQGKEIAFNAGMPHRTAQRFFGNQVLFHKVKNGTYMKKIVFEEM